MGVPIRIWYGYLAIVMKVNTEFWCTSWCTSWCTMVHCWISSLEWNVMEWKIMKRIILEYSSLPLFGSFNRRNGMDRREHSFLSIPLKSQIFIPLKLEGMRGNEIRFNDFFTETPKTPLYIQLFILKYGSNNNIVIKSFHFIPSLLLPNKITYIPFISFLYFKTSN